MKILHIGYEKTGTTFLQTRLFGPLARKGIISAYIGQDGINRRVSSSTLHLALQALGRGKNVTHLSNEVSNFILNHPNFLISVEQILGHSSDKNISEFSRRLSTVFDRDTEVVITIRSLDSYFSSLYQQRVKGDYVTSPEDWLLPSQDPRFASVRRIPPPNFEKYDLDSLVTALLKYFDYVTLIDLQCSGYLSWISNRTGVPIQELQDLIKSKAKSRKGENKSLPPEIVRSLEMLNQLLRSLLKLVKVRGDISWVGFKASQELSWQDKVKKRLILSSEIVKELARLFAQTLTNFIPQRTKYQLPEKINQQILSMIPKSELLDRVKEAGGVLTLTKESPLLHHG